jgi:hypothetical protein
VAVSSQNQDRLARALQRFGFSEHAVSLRPLLEKPKFLRIGHPPLRVEIHSAISGCEFEECLVRSEHCLINGLDVRFISLSDLRRNKLAAGRTKDLADLEELPEA